MDDDDERKAVIAVLVGIFVAVLAYVGLSRLRNAGSRNRPQAARARRGVPRTHPSHARSRDARTFTRSGEARRARWTTALKILGSIAAGVTIVVGTLSMVEFFR